MGATGLCRFFFPLQENFYTYKRTKGEEGEELRSVNIFILERNCPLVLWRNFRWKLAWSTLSSIVASPSWSFSGFPYSPAPFSTNTVELPSQGRKEYIYKLNNLIDLKLRIQRNVNSRLWNYILRIQDIELTKRERNIITHS